MSDPRFEIAGVLPPDSKGDFAFLLHGLYHLRKGGTMAIVLPHGVLFRGGVEGEIRRRLLDRNHIDAVLGLPSKLFTNTGIPVVVLILKKNKEMGEPVLIIDASREFKKEGRQNVLQEKHIARIVDTYLERNVQEGYSSLVYREDILKNDYNLNIPRYVVAKSDDIAHDVDAHLLGGIPERDIKELKILGTMVPEILADSFRPIRPLYLELATDIDDLTEKVMQSDVVTASTEKMVKTINEYTARYWDIITVAKGETNAKEIMNEMLVDIKNLLSGFNFVNIYDGYQVITEIWRDFLTKDIEIIAQSDFYTAARTRVPKMVTRGTGNNKREEQDGWYTYGSSISRRLPDY